MNDFLYLWTGIITKIIGNLKISQNSMIMIRMNKKIIIVQCKKSFSKNVILDSTYVIKGIIFGLANRYWSFTGYYLLR